MSCDLFFYKPKHSVLSEEVIAEYLSKNLVTKHEHASQWFFENEDTEVYYSFDRNVPDNDPEYIELYESFDHFDNTHFSFNLNFMRPAFFGLEAFAFVEKMLADLDLYLLNSQLATDVPAKQTKEELFENWNDTNIRASIDHFEKTQSSFIPAKKSNAAWNYNYQRKQLQEESGNEYFVPKIFFCKRKSDGEMITLATWTEHILNVFPPADYFALWRKYNKWFKTVQENIVIDRATLLKEFGEFFEDFPFEDCKVIHPVKTIRIADKFNSIKSHLKLEDFTRVAIENLYNAKPVAK